MIRPGRGAPLLAGLSAGAVLVGSMVLAGPVAALPPAVRAALGVPVAVAVAVPPVAVPTVALPTTTPPAAPTTGPRPVRHRQPVPASTTTAPTTEPPPPEPQPTPAPEPGPDLAEAVLIATNAARADAGCEDLVPDRRLAAAAQGHAEDMAEHDYFSHTGRDGSDAGERIHAAGHPDPRGENIAQGHRTAREVVRAWLRSPGHRRNILDCDLTSVGVGFDGRGNYWVQNFGG